MINNSDLPQVSIFKPLKVLPNLGGRKFNSFFIRAQIEFATKHLGWGEFDVWVNDQKARHYLPTHGSKKLIYDITDDWTQLEQPLRVKRSVIEDDSWMMHNADEIIVCSEWLYAKSKLVKPGKVHLIANGVDGLRYHPDALADLARPREFEGIAGKIAGYVGTLHDERLDLDLIEQVAALLPEITFVFIGPNCLNAKQTSLLEASPNVRIFGARSYQHLPSYIKFLDLCITPHKVTSFTESLDPLKLYEYMSTGKPIVSTPCAGFRELPQLIRTASNSRDFANAVLASIAEDRLQDLRIEWSRKQTWQCRADDVSAVLGWT